MKRTIAKILLLLVLTLICVPASQAEMTASAVLAKAASSISGSRGIKATAAISGTGECSIEQSGSKFHITIPMAEVWYDGANLWSLNKRTKEATVTKPTKEELAEVNPLLLIASAPTVFNAAFSKNQPEGSYQLALTARSKKYPVTRATATIRKKGYVPVKIIFRGNSGETTTVSIKSFKQGVTFPATTFTFPKSKYPNVKITDLR